MDKTTANQIDHLLKSSGLFSNEEQTSNNISNLDFSEETILITGAAGSIGSELSKQLCSCSFKEIILIDIAESALFNLMQDTVFETVSRVKFLIIDITKKDDIEHLFETYKPTIIFHTAAYKHVPLMENNPLQAIRVNIFGTKLLADLAIRYNVKKFIFISTDKAVEPIGIMGISKRISEDYLSSLSTSNSTQFLMARFGNVFGSNGSVGVLFKNRIEKGESITITHKETSRYFISKQKACTLILQIAKSNYSESGLFTFDMGKPIKIIDLLERMKLFYNRKKVEIKFSKLRAGEKLHENLISPNEILEPTAIHDVLLVKKKEKIIFPSSYLENLSKLKASTSKEDIKAILRSYL